MNLYIHKVLQILFDSTMKKKSATVLGNEYKEKAIIYHWKKIFLKFKPEQKKKHMTMDGCNKIFIENQYDKSFIEHRNTYNSSPFPINGNVTLA